MKRVLHLLILLLLTLSALAQDTGKKKKKMSFKVPKLNIGEKIGKLSGNLMTGKTDILSEASSIITLTCGIYPPEIKTSESKYFPEGTTEGDFIISSTFTKAAGMGLLEITGDVKADGQPMEYVGLGSYLRVYKRPTSEPINLTVKTTTGDEASFMVSAIPGVEIISVNGEQSLPILDMDEDIELVYFNPAGSEGTRIRVSLVSDVMGARALNHFADFDVKEMGEIKVTIPKEALANPEIAGQLNAGNFKNGENWLIIERKKSLPSSKYGAEQKPGSLSSSEIQMVSYATMPVIVKGKQDDGLVASLRVTGRSADRKTGYDFYKPNATTGIPFSKASKFGLTSFTMTANTFKQESKTTSRSSTIGNTTYTRTTTVTTTYDFPELPSEYWEYVMDRIYNDVVDFFKTEYNIEFAPVEEVIGTPEYTGLFPTDDVMDDKTVKKSYKGTKRTNPSSLVEILGGASTNLTSDNPTVNMMKNAGELDGLLSMQLNLEVAGNDHKNIVLIPSLRLSIVGRDETNNNKLGRYVDCYINLPAGEPYYEAALLASQNELLRVSSHYQLISALKDGIKTLRAKEVEMGYDKIWNIGE